MALGAIQYVAVTWTTGDTATEVKMDNMVANDQAYDSHAAQGLLLNNNVGYYQKNAAGTNKAVLNMGADDVLRFGPHERQDLTTNSTIDSNAILTGWSYCLGDSVHAYSSAKAITFGITFSAIPVVVATSIGYKDGSNPTTIDDFGSWPNTNIALESLATTGFTAKVMTIDATIIENTRRVGFAWMAIGALA